MILVPSQTPLIPQGLGFMAWGLVWLGIEGFTLRDSGVCGVVFFLDVGF